MSQALQNVGEAAGAAADVRAVARALELEAADVRRRAAAINGACLARAAWGGSSGGRGLGRTWTVVGDGLPATAADRAKGGRQNKRLTGDQAGKEWTPEQQKRRGQRRSSGGDGRATQRRKRPQAKMDVIPESLTRIVG